MSETLEPNKKLVCQTIMGWRYRSYDTTGFAMNIKDITKPDGERFETHAWNPHEDPRCWSEIWESMKRLDVLDKYIVTLHEIFLEILDKSKIKTESPAELFAYELHWIHTLDPEINWIALIRTIEALKLKKLPFKLIKKPKKELPRVSIGHLLDVDFANTFRQRGSDELRK